MTPAELARYQLLGGQPFTHASSASANGLIPYQNYLEYFRPIESSESGGTTQPLSEQQWNSFGLQQQLNNMGNEWSMTADDPRVQQFAQQFGQSNFQNSGRPNDTNLVTTMGNPQMYGRPFEEWAIDPSRVLRNSDGSITYEANNVRGQSLADMQQTDSDSGIGDGRNWTIAAIATLLGGYAAAGALGGGAAAGGAAPGMSTSVGGGFGTGALGSGGTGASFGTGFSAADGLLGAGASGGPTSGLNVTGSGNAGVGNAGQGVSGGSGSVDFGGLGPDASGTSWNGTFGEGGLDPNTLGGQGGMGVSQNGLGSWNSLPWQDRLAGAIANPSSLGSSTGLLSQGGQGLLQSAMNNPRQLYNAYQLGSSLFGGSDSNGGGNSSSGSKGGSGTGPKIDRPNFTPNPYLLAQLQRGGYAQPGGF